MKHHKQKSAILTHMLPMLKALENTGTYHMTNFQRGGRPET
ncbi:hypothetical protein [Sediminicola luteus]|uniref:Uncharacterized protein n=1 Tax=Sediminicola luteus TaxID=319238 RepID=A0ABV2TXM6_9FLAO